VPARVFSVYHIVTFRPEVRRTGAAVPPPGEGVRDVVGRGRFDSIPDLLYNPNQTPLRTSTRKDFRWHINQ